MGGALLKGWLAAGHKSVTAVEPKPPAWLRRNATVLDDVSAARGRYAACVVALKPQILKSEAVRLKPIADGGALMISIAAGTTIKSLAKAWGPKARIVRAMPNLPGQIAKGISALYAPKHVPAKDRALAQSLLAALGQTVWVAREGLIDSVTAVSGSGPAYVFLLVEALAEAARNEGLPPDAAKQLARAIDHRRGRAARSRRAIRHRSAHLRHEPGWDHRSRAESAHGERRHGTVDGPRRGPPPTSAPRNSAPELGA